MKILLVAIAILAVNLGYAQKDPEHIQITKKIGYRTPISSESGFWWQENLEGSAKEKLFETIMSEIRSGNLDAYGLDAAHQPSKTTENKLSIEQVDSIMNPTFTRIVENLETGEQDITTTQSSLGPKDISSVYCIESWNYNLKEHCMKKTVDGLAFMIGDVDSNGNLRGHYPLFYVWFNNGQ